VIARDIDCVIERRLLVSYRLDPGRVDALLPRPFRPQLVNGHAVGGVCFIRMSALRPAPLPRAAGLTTENVAHRFAVEWDDEHGTRAGVYVPRRDTSSRITATLGARMFPGAYHLARFDVTESAGMIRIGVRSRDLLVSLSVSAAPAAALRSGLFASLDEATRFFRRGALGFSPSAANGCLDGVHLHATSWAARPMIITAMSSSLFDDAAIFPGDSRALDSALLMTNITARWSAQPASLLAASQAAA
jgi:uncharacterized protein YqjF (DUF2071 family)